MVISNASIGVIGGSVTATTGKLNGLREWEGYVCQKRVWNEQKSYLWPIPDLEINSNKELGNNPDYPEITIQKPWLLICLIFLLRSRLVNLIVISKGFIDSCIKLFLL